MPENPSKKIFRLLISCVAALMIGLPLFGQPNLSSNVVKETLAYATKERQTLFLDKYRTKEVFEKPSPCIVFIHGGSFKGGTRDNQSYAEYFDYMAKQGYTVVSIDYRLGMKGATSKNYTEATTMLKKAVDMAVEDLYDATGFILRHASEWKVNPEKIIISGSSAGAVTVLQAEYEYCNRSNIASRLPDNFRYAGVIGFAGAVLSLNGNLTWKNKPAPMLLFHGNADDMVPFGKIDKGNVSLCGSEYIASRLHHFGFPHCFFLYEGSAHEISRMPMKKNLPEIQRFLEVMVFSGEALMLRIQAEEIDKKKPERTLTSEDFFKKNFK